MRVDQAGDGDQGEKPHHYEVLDRVHAQDLERVEFLVHLAGTKVGRDRRAGDPGDDDARDRRPISRTEPRTKQVASRSSAAKIVRKLAAATPKAMRQPRRPPAGAGLAGA